MKYSELIKELRNKLLLTQTEFATLLGVSYAIGVSEPVSLYIDTFGTGKVSDDELLKLLNNHFNFTPANINVNVNAKVSHYIGAKLSHFLIL